MIDDQHKAFHEAGHALIVYHVGLPLDFVSIETQAEGAAVAQHGNFRDINSGDEPSLERVDYMFRSWLAISLAGVVAAYMATGIVPLEASSDFDVCSGLAQLCPNEDDLRYWYLDAMSYLWETLLEEWEALARLARALLAQRTLTRAQAEEIIESCAPRELPAHAMTCPARERKPLL